MLLDKTHFFFAATTTIMLLALPANADERSVDTAQHDDGYGYVFRDDVLSATDHGTNIVPIKVLPRGMRQTLIRPRVQFIAELLQSVEQI